MGSFFFQDLRNTLQSMRRKSLVIILTTSLIGLVVVAWLVLGSQKCRWVFNQQSTVSLCDLCRCQIVSYDQSVLQLIDPESGATKTVFNNPSANGVAPSFFVASISPSSRYGIVSSSTSQTFTIRPISGELKTSQEIDTQGSLRMNQFGWSPNENWLIWSEFSRRVSTFEDLANNPERIFLLNRDSSQTTDITPTDPLIGVRSLVIDDSGQHALVVTQDGTDRRFFLWKGDRRWIQLELPKEYTDSATYELDVVIVDENLWIITIPGRIALLNPATGNYVEKNIRTWGDRSVVVVQGKTFLIQRHDEFAYGQIYRVNRDLRPIELVLDRLTTSTLRDITSTPDGRFLIFPDFYRDRWLVVDTAKKAQQQPATLLVPGKTPSTLTITGLLPK